MPGRPRHTKPHTRPGARTRSLLRTSARPLLRIQAWRLRIPCCAMPKPPKQRQRPPGTAAVGTEKSTFARGDHVHPAQTTITGNAGTATKLATARTIDGVSFNGSANIIHYGTCSTAAETAAKAVNCTGFVLATGARIAVRFTVTNTAANPTLNVNATGAKAIRYRNAAIAAGIPCRKQDI